MAGTTFHFEAIGTHWNIELSEELEGNSRTHLEKKIMQRIDQFDLAYSRFRDDSLVAEMSKKSGIYELPPDGPKMFLLYEHVMNVTDGRVTPLIGSLMEEAGYDKKYSLIPKELHKPPSWNDTVIFDGERLTLKQPVLIDVGAAGKGYLVDLVGAVLEAEGYSNYTIDAGGDIIHRGEGGAVLRVGLEHPLDTTKVIGVVELSDESICGSAGNRRAWDRFTHIIDPTTLSSPTEILATWAIAETTMLADMLATCLFFVSPELLKPHFEFEFIVLHKDLSVTHSPKLKADFY